MEYDLDDLYTLLDGAKRYERYIAARCVYHNDRNPSMMVYPDGFYCKSCGAGGTLEKLAKRLRSPLLDLHYVEEIDFEAPWRKWLDKYGNLETLAKIAYRTLTKFPGKLKYLKRRKIISLVKELRLGWLDKYYFFPVFDEFGDVAEITIRAEQSIADRYGVRYLSSPRGGKLLYIPQGNSIYDEEEIYVVFGTIDVLAMHVAGFPTVTAGSKTFPAELLENFNVPIYIIPDRMEEVDAMELAHQLGWKGHPLFLDYPDDCRDPADVLELHSADLLQSIIEEAKLCLDGNRKAR